MEREVEVEVAEAEREGSLPERVVRVSGGVRPDDRGDGRQKQQHRADAVLAHGPDLLGDRPARA
jgi:hypothetical protein